MAIATADEFLLLYPEFASTPLESDHIDYWLQRVEAIYCPASFWTDPLRQQTAVMLRTAHILECQRQQMAQTASIGAAVSQGQSVSVPQVIESDLSQTTYGRQFLELRRLSPATGFRF